MTDTFLDDHTTVQFIRDARTIAKFLPHMPTFTGWNTIQHIAEGSPRW